jgi:hypothetical protein
MCKLKCEGKDGVVTNSSSPPGWRRGHWSALEPPGIVDYLSGGRPWNVLEGSLPQCLQGSEGL